MKITHWLLFLLLPLGLSSCRGCTSPAAGDAGEPPAAGRPVEIRHARGFTATDHGAYTLVEIGDPTGENPVRYRYALLRRGASAEGIPAGYEVIEVPVRRVVCLTTLQLSNFIALGAQDRVAGMTSTRFLFDETMKRQLAAGTTRRIGIEGEFDVEAVIALDPDVILVSPFKRGGYDALANLGIPTIAFLGYQESSPLGQAEWIKFTAMLLGEEAAAGAKFDGISSRYDTLKALAAGAARRPLVLSGELHSGNWYVVGGESYLAQLFRDAGADYFLKDNEETGGYYVDFETVYARGAGADFWRLVNSHDGAFDYEALRRSDARYADFKAFAERKVIYCNLRQTPFYENTPVQPDVVLADLIHIFHPELLPDHIPVFYSLLQ
jgi:iron complex transport system substrate-binding protein